MHNVPYLILGLVIATVIPLGMLKLAILYADRIQNKMDEEDKERKRLNRIKADLRNASKHTK